MGEQEADDISVSVCGRQVQRGVPCLVRIGFGKGGDRGRGVGGGKEVGEDAREAEDAGRVDGGEAWVEDELEGVF